MVLTLAFGIPVYICSTAAVPFALGLLAAGLSPGAAMAFLVGGPGVSASTLLAVNRLLGLRSTILYVTVLSVCAIGFGLLVEMLLPAGWIPPGTASVAHHAHGAEGLPWPMHARAVLLVAVVAWAKWGHRVALASGLKDVYKRQVSRRQPDNDHRHAPPPATTHRYQSLWQSEWEPPPFSPLLHPPESLLRGGRPPSALRLPAIRIPAGLGPL